MKHAYLIIANRNPFQLQMLINTLDDSRNDIYILFDKKSNMMRYKYHSVYSYIEYLSPINIYWGEYSQIDAEIRLLSSAITEHYTYYHLLSGLDLPLTNQDDIHNFFDNNLNKEFITYGNPTNLGDLNLRIKTHLFREQYRTNNRCINYYRKFEKRALKFLPQYKIPKSKINYASQWFSIDDNLAHLIISSSDFIQLKFNSGFLVDEVFIPTLINYYPSIKHKIYYDIPVNDNPSEFQGNLRYINWWDGSPYIWTINDYDKLIYANQKGHLFSRKFDEQVDYKIIKKLINNIT